MSGMGHREREKDVENVFALQMVLSSNSTVTHDVIIMSKMTRFICFSRASITVFFSLTFTDSSEFPPVTVAATSPEIVCLFIYCFLVLKAK